MPRQATSLHDAARIADRSFDWEWAERLRVVDEEWNGAERRRNREEYQRGQREPLIDRRVAHERAADEESFLDLVDRTRRRFEIARGVGVEVAAAVPANRLEEALDLRLVANFLLQIDADHVHADVRGVRLAKDLHRVAPLVVLAVREDDDHLIAPIAPQPTLLRIAVGGGREQMVRQCQPVANRGHPFSAEQLIVNEIDVTDHVLVIE